MNADNPRDRLAEYLGEELNERDRVAMTRRINDDPALATEVQGLERALEALRRLDPASDMAAGVTGQRAAAPRPNQLTTMLRRAAIIMLAFLAGFALRAAMPSGAAGAPDHGGSESAAAITNSHWTTRAAATYMGHQDKSSLARALIAVTQPGPAPDLATDR